MRRTRLGITGTEILVHAVLLVAALACVFPATFLRGAMIAPGDVLYETYPWKAYSTGDQPYTHRLILDAITAMAAYYAVGERDLEEGVWPLWNPLEYGGMPLLANFQSAVFYPPRLLHAFLDLFVATTLYILLKLWLCGMTAYVCGRGLGLSRGMARILSLAWMLATYNLVWCYWPLPDVSAWAPLVLLGVEWILEGALRRGFYLLAASGVLLLLAGHPETALAFGLGVAVYMAVRLALARPSGRDVWRMTAAAGSAWALALLVCAGQVLPFLEYLRNSYSLAERATHTTDTRMLYGPGDLVCCWLPRFYGTWMERTFWGKWNSNVTAMLYPGMVTWLGVSVLGARAARDRVFRGRAAALGVSALALGLLAFDAPLFGLLHRLPVLNAMYRYYYMSWTLLALVTLGCLGLDRWLSQPRRLRELAHAAPLVLVAAGITAATFRFHRGLIGMLGLEPYLRGEMLAAALFLGAGLAVLALRALGVRRQTVVLLAGTLLVVDLTYAVRGLLVTSPRERLFPRTELTDYLQSLESPLRVTSLTGLIPGGLLAFYGVEDWFGYDGIYPERVLRFQVELGTDVWKSMEPACAIPYYLHDMRVPPQFPRDEGGRFERVAALDGIEVYRNLAAFPRAYLVGRARIVEDTKAMFSIMREPGFDPAREALLETAPEGPLPDTEPEGLGQAAVTERTSSQVRVAVEAARPAVLVMADAFYPGWKARVDGRPAEVFPVFYAFRGVLMPAGEHEVEMYYAPWTFYAGLAISVATLAGSIVVCLCMLARRAQRRRDMGQGCSGAEARATM